MRGEVIGRSDGWSLVGQIRKLLSAEWEVRICHVYREANRSADALANLGCLDGPQLMFYEHPLVQVAQLLLLDVMGVSTPRTISV